MLTDEMWEDLSPLLPGHAWSCGVAATDTRGFVGAVLWLGRTGAPWRDLPAHLGQWHRVYVRFARWRDKGACGQVTDWLIENKRKVPHSQQQQQRQVDSTSIGVHQHGTGAEKNGEQGVGRSRGGNTSKLQLVGDGAGNVLGWQDKGRAGGRDP